MSAFLIAVAAEVIGGLITSAIIFGIRYLIKKHEENRLEQ